MSKMKIAPLPDLFNSSKRPEIDNSSDLRVGASNPHPLEDVRKNDRSSQRELQQQFKRTHETGNTLSANEKYLTDKYVAARFGVSRPTIWRWTKGDFGFPQPVQVTPGTTRWRLSDICQFEQKLLSGTNGFKAAHREKQRVRRDGS